jgi:hypothetical protein
VSSVSDELDWFVDTHIIRDQYGPDAQLARSLPAPASEGPGAWFVLPGHNSVCFFDGSAGTCASMKEARAGRLFLIRFPKPKGKAQPGVPPTLGTPTVIGIAPDDVTKITVVTSNGQRTSGTPRGGAYAITPAHRELKALMLHRADGTTTSLPLGPR